MTAHLLRMTQVFIAQDIGVEYPRFRRQGSQQLILSRHNRAQAGPEVVRVKQLAHAHAADAPHFVLIAGTDASSRRADGLAGALLAQAFFF